jgi:hypothetical protein
MAVVQEPTAQYSSYPHSRRSLLVATTREHVVVEHCGGESGALDGIPVTFGVPVAGSNVTDDDMVMYSLLVGLIDAVTVTKSMSSTR